MSSADRATTPTRMPRIREARGRDGVISLDLDRELVDLPRGMARALVDSHDALAAGAAREAEDLAGLGVEPGSFEVDALVSLDRQVALVRLLELRGGDAHEAAVDIHECRHGPSPVAAGAVRESPVLGQDSRPGRPRCHRSDDRCPVRAGT